MVVVCAIEWVSAALVIGASFTVGDIFIVGIMIVSANSCLVGTEKEVVFVVLDLDSVPVFFF